MRVYLSDEFDGWLARVEEKASAGDMHASRLLDYLASGLDLLRNLDGPPTPEQETARLKPVRQSRRYPLWRVAHPFDKDIAVRVICWFPPDSATVVVTLFAGDKAQMGDVFYNSVGTRADAAIDRWLYQQDEQMEEDDE